jgi:hypothetical protein
MALREITEREIALTALAKLTSQRHLCSDVEASIRDNHCLVIE